MHAILLKTSVLLFSLSFSKGLQYFTDTRRNKRFTGKIIATFSDNYGNPIACLTHCLANKKKCKSINVNEKFRKCELLGQSKLMDDGLEMKNEEGWIYYGPGKTPEVSKVQKMKE